MCREEIPSRVGKLCGSRPMKIKKSEWEKKNAAQISLLRVGSVS